MTPPPLTLEQALAIVHPWLGTWKAGQQCEGAIAFALSSNPNVVCSCGRRDHTSPYDDGLHDISMPPATDELAMKVLRKGRISIWWAESNKVWQAHANESYAISVSADDPRDAIILAAATWLQSQEKQKE